MTVHISQAVVKSQWDKSFERPNAAPGMWQVPNSLPSISSQVLTPFHHLHHWGNWGHVTSPQSIDSAFRSKYKGGHLCPPSHGSLAPRQLSGWVPIVPGVAKQITTKLSYAPPFPALQWRAGKIQPTRQDAKPPASHSYKRVGGQHFKRQKFWHVFWEITCESQTWVWILALPFNNYVIFGHYRSRGKRMSILMSLTPFFRNLTCPVSF